jgi:hypothetical protein
VGIFAGMKLERHGVNVMGTVEHVVVTDQTASGGMPYNDPDRDDGTIVYVTIQFVDANGASHVADKKEHYSYLKDLPAPGSRVEIQYLPDDPSNCDYFRAYPPDPSVPRGWGAGIFEVTPSKHHTVSPIAGAEFSRQRERFRTGTRATAQIITVDALDPHLHNRMSRQYRFGLKAAGRDLTATAWVPFNSVPAPGDTIEIAIGGDRAEVVLDTDERHDGPPGQALVFRSATPVAPPPPLAPRPPPSSPAEKVPHGMTGLPAGAPSTKSTLMQAAAARYLAGEITIDELKEIQGRIARG